MINTVQPAEITKGDSDANDITVPVSDARTMVKPDEGKAILFRRKIGKTNYLVRVHFNPDSRETLGEKMGRIISNEVRYGSLADTSC